MHVFRIGFGCCLFVATLASHPCRGQNDSDSRPTVDQRFVSGLRQRRLYELADEYCRQRLASQDLQPLDQVRLVLQLIQTRVQRASAAAPSEQNKAWQNAHEAATGFIAQHGSFPRILLVSLQDALTWLAEGELLRRQWELQPNAGDQQQAAEILRRAAQQLAAVQRQIREFQSRGPSTTTRDDLSPTQLLAMSNHVTFEAARCSQNQAVLAGDDDRLTRIDALSQVDRQLTELNGKVSRDDVLWWQIQLLRSECQRSLGRVADAARLWDGIEPSAVPESVASKWWAEQVHLELDAGHPERAVLRLNDMGAQYQSDPELALALVELFIAESNRQTDAGQRELWQQRASSLVQSIQSDHGDYWARRASLLVAKLSTRKRSIVQFHFGHGTG